MTSRGVLMVTGAYWPELSGGGLQCRTMITALGDRLRFRVLTTSTDPALPRDSEVEGIPVHRVYIDLSRSWTKLAAAAQTLAFLLRHRRAFDVVHLHGFSQKAVLIVVMARLLRKKVVLTIHTAGQDEASEARRRGGLTYWAYRQADRYVAISSRIAANYLADGLPESKLTVAPNGVDVSRFHPPAAAEREEARAALNLSPALAWILFVGFFSKEKAPDVLFEAWLSMQATAPPSGLLFVGATDSAYHEVDKTLATGIAERARARGLSDRVRFTGAIDNITRAYHAADIFAMPSTREAFGMVLVEAMASGLPVVASKIDGVTDDIVSAGRTGVLVPTSDVAALAGALEHLLIDRARAAQMGRQAREAVSDRYGINAARDRWLALYESLGMPT